jgi:hypothetical protein
VPVTVAVGRGLDVDRLQVLADSRSFVTIRQPPYTASWDAGSATVGNHVLKAFATLADGRVVTDQVEVVVGRPTKPLWTGDFSTGDLSQWKGPYLAAATLGGERLRIVRAPGGGYAARFEVRPGDRPVDQGGDRNELINQDRDLNGVVAGDGPRWYAWETYVPEDYASAPGYQTITQWHQSQIPAPSPLKVMLADDDRSFALRGRETPDEPDVTLAEAPLERGRWHRWVVGVDWSPDPAEGWVEAYLDGRQVLPRTHRATQYRTADGTVIFNAFKQGLYRDRGITVAQSLLLRGTRIGLTPASVGGP